MSVSYLIYRSHDEVGESGRVLGEMVIALLSKLYNANGQLFFQPFLENTYAALRGATATAGKAVWDWGKSVFTVENCRALALRAIRSSIHVLTLGESALEKKIN